MNPLEERRIQCPYCGEWMDILLDCAFLEQGSTEDAYIEDCQVCCRPMHIRVTQESGELSVRVLTENDVY